jgi:glucose-6-phosphate isomerase
MTLPHETEAWARLAGRAGEEPTEPAPAFAAAGIWFDWRRTMIPPGLLHDLERLAEATDLEGQFRALERGEIVNPSEGRAATHMAVRDPANRSGHGGTQEAAGMLRDGRFDHVLLIGIGGSALGPALLVDALGDNGDGPEVRVVSNIDGVALARALGGAAPARTALVAVSKTFTTLETMTNLESALAWMGAGGVVKPAHQLWAVTAAPARAAALGLPPEHILAFDESVGGRYSLWSAVGIALPVRCGWGAFEALLAGAHAMDRHVLTAPFARNAGTLAGALAVWHACICRKPTRGVFAYDERLRLLPAYLQQLEMESNGKSVSRDGRPLPFPTAPVTWGGTGTDAQHAVFQLLHQGSHADPVDFIAVSAPGHALDAGHHRQLLANCFAQGQALQQGRSLEEARALSGGDEALARQRSFPGARPTATILLDSLTPERLGALIAFHEARTFTFAALTGLNPFDQWGVELGKEVANSIAAGEGAIDAVTRDLLARSQSRAA